MIILENARLLSVLSLNAESLRLVSKYPPAA
jgi:hypothetical protein